MSADRFRDWFARRSVLKLPEMRKQGMAQQVKQPAKDIEALINRRTEFEGLDGPLMSVLESVLSTWLTDTGWFAMLLLAGERCVK